MMGVDRIDVLFLILEKFKGVSKVIELIEFGYVVI